MFPHLLNIKLRQFWIVYKCQYHRLRDGRLQQCCIHDCIYLHGCTHLLLLLKMHCEIRAHPITLCLLGPLSQTVELFVTRQWKCSLPRHHCGQGMTTFQPYYPHNNATPLLRPPSPPHAVTPEIEMAQKNYKWTTWIWHFWNMQGKLI